ncbi:MAG: hypothetical protein FJY86_02170 [Candidatus Diapherotrites archaeon]|uniref:Uncharacterized protein n=1 Tax=Candidatus Iainarchaeum sp. TaxID=3101447 RepID=A0A8T4CAG7_9ARCH|nr:hypothetical protein [Candidatus Diapherotrites archaeon]
MPPARIPIDKLRSLIPLESVSELNLPDKGEVELSRLETNTWLLSLPSVQKDLVESSGFVLKPIHQKVLRLLKTHRLPDLIEGRFERFLAGEELSAFNELLHAGKIVVIKTNPKFDKGIYREPIPSVDNTTVSHSSNSIPPSNVKKIITHTQVIEKPMEEYSLVNDGFMVLRSDGAAKAASFDLQERIRNGEVKGIKTFDGFYYIVENSLLEKYTGKLVGFLQTKKKEELSALALSQAIPPILARIILEFAKEDGIVIEKQKNLYAYVG